MSTTFSINFSLPGKRYLGFTLTVGAYFGRTDEDDDDDLDLEDDDLDLEDDEG